MDSLLVAGLYKKLKGVDRRYWLLSALQKTFLPVALVVIFFAIAGYLFQMAVPEARSIGEVWANFLPR